MQSKLHIDKAGPHLITSEIEFSAFQIESQLCTRLIITSCYSNITCTLGFTFLYSNCLFCCVIRQLNFHEQTTRDIYVMCQAIHCTILEVFRRIFF